MKNNLEDLGLIALDCLQIRIIEGGAEPAYGLAYYAGQYVRACNAVNAAFFKTAGTTLINLIK